VAKLFCSCVSFTLSKATPINHRLHKLQEVGVGTVHDGDAMGSNLTIDSGESAKTNVVEYESILTNPFQEESKEWAFKTSKMGWIPSIYVSPCSRPILSGRA
jgi:hypothetical protein